MQNKPNLLDAKMNVNPSITKEYENLQLFSRCKNKPNQSQSNPIYSELVESIKPKNGFVLHQPWPKNGGLNINFFLMSL
jgi:hypothetical protein